MTKKRDWHLTLSLKARATPVSHCQMCACNLMNRSSTVLVTQNISISTTVQKKCTTTLIVMVIIHWASSQNISKESCGSGRMLCYWKQEGGSTWVVALFLTPPDIRRSNCIPNVYVTSDHHIY